jgi:hypothetical protein
LSGVSHAFREQRLPGATNVNIGAQKNSRVWDFTIPDAKGQAIRSSLNTSTEQHYQGAKMLGISAVTRDLNFLLKGHID